MNQAVGKLSRRTLFAGAGAVGAAATVASLMPASQPAQTAEQQQDRPAPTKGGGYHLSEHVKRYFKTAQI